MVGLFLKLLNMSISASWLVLMVVFLRLLLKKAPKAFRCILWALVGIRLLCPVSIESVWSLIPSAETIPQDIVYAPEPMIQSGISALNSVVNPFISESLAPGFENSGSPMQTVLLVASSVWAIGVVAMVLYALVSYIRIRKKVREAALLYENICICDFIDSPFILGIIRPRIYLPSAMEEQDMEYVVAHEFTHFLRPDHSRNFYNELSKIMPDYKKRRQKLNEISIR